MAAAAVDEGVDAPAALRCGDPGAEVGTRNPLGSSHAAMEGDDGVADSRECGGMERAGYDDACGASLEGDGAADVEIDEHSEPSSKDGTSAAEATVSKERAAPRITLELLSQGGFYDMPMAKAAQLLGRTEGSFQRVCRGLGILRWPYRVRKSLQAIMAKTEEYLGDETQEDGMSKAEVLKVLRDRMDDIKGISGTGMDKATKQYRQYIFKLNHKLARRAGKKGDEVPDAGPLKAKGILRAASKIQQPKREGAASSFLSEQASEPSAMAHASGDASRPARPTPRRIRDLPDGLALQQLGSAYSGEAAAVQSRARSAAVGDYQKACLQDDQELLRLCREMDEHLRAAREALMLRGPFFPAQLPPLLTSSLYLQQVMGVGMAPLPQPPGLPPPPMFLPPPPSQGGLPGQSFWPVR